jgi:hypothetical protein
MLRVDHSLLYKDLKEFILMQLRGGYSLDSIRQALVRAEDDIDTVGPFMEAINDSKMAP